MTDNGQQSDQKSSLEHSVKMERIGYKNVWKYLMFISLLNIKYE